MKWNDAEKILPTLNGVIYEGCLEESNPVLLYGLNPKMEETWMIGTYVYDHDEGTGEWVGASLDDYDVSYCTVTHWANLPDSPDIGKALETFGSI